MHDYLTGRVLRLVLLFAVVAVIGCGDQNSANGRSVEANATSQRTDELRPVKWNIFGPPSGRRIKIVIEVEYCAGTTQPRIETVRIKERKGKILLTAMLYDPASKNRGQACAGVGLAVFKKVWLRTELKGRSIYDASASPPQKRWPK
jgi:hypothetical protein